MMVACIYARIVACCKVHLHCLLWSLQTCAQVLLTLNNLSDRGPYLNARNTFQELLAYDTVPIVNENDTIAVEEIRFGDNDTLSSQVLLAFHDCANSHA